VASDDVVVWTVFHVATERMSSVAVFSARSFVAI
jgi:hypothetical protein